MNDENIKGTNAAAENKVMGNANGGTEDNHREPNNEETLQFQYGKKASKAKASNITSQGESEVVKLKEELATANNKAEENWNLLLRAKAEIENVRRRSRLDVEKAHKFGSESFAKELLHVVDSLEKGLEVIPDNEEVKSIRHGTELTYKLLLDTLEKFSIKITNPVGEIFNPAQHEALSMQESDEVEPNKILVVVQKGFTIHERVLRPARVVVAKASTSSSPKIDEKV